MKLLLSALSLRDPWILLSGLANGYKRGILLVWVVFSSLSLSLWNAFVL